MAAGVFLTAFILGAFVCPHITVVDVPVIHVALTEKVIRITCVIITALSLGMAGFKMAQSWDPAPEHD